MSRFGSKNGTKYVRFSVRCVIRDLVYSARVDAKTGALLGVYARCYACCRVWNTFDEAKAHYSSINEDTSGKRVRKVADDGSVVYRWSNDWLALDGNADFYNELFAHRLEARTALRNLQLKVAHYLANSLHAE